MKAMILAAGFGTRLKPLTEKIPKPLLPVGNRPQIEYVLELLYRAGVREVMINLHHLGGLIQNALGSSYRGTVSLNYSHEKEILGTGGGLKKVENFFDCDTFLMVNSDSLLDVDLEGAITRHIERKAAATMVVRRWEEGSGYGRVEIDPQGMIKRILGRGSGENLTPVIFTGVHILSRRIFKYIPAGSFSCINRDCYGAMLEAGETVCACAAEGYWKDLGTLPGYFEANMDLLDGVTPEYCNGLFSLPGARSYTAEFPQADLDDPVFIGKQCEIGSGSGIGPSVILGDGTRVGKECSIRRAVTLPGAILDDGESISDCIRWGRRSYGIK